MPLSKIQLSQAGGRRNLIHNGAMKVAQRGEQTGLTTGAHRVDRYKLTTSGGAVVTADQTAIASNLPPAGDGFTKSLRIKCTTDAGSIAAGEYSILYHRIEGQDLQNLLYGTSSAKKLTVQFWVRSAKTGIHIVELNHLDAAYQNSQQYTISSADTWEKKTVTFVGYPTTGFDDDVNGSLQLAWWLVAGSTFSGGTHNSNTWHNTAANRAVGQVNVLDAVNNNFYLTGVQMEVGDAATEFEHRSFGEELALCQRYYYQVQMTGSNAAYLGSGGVYRTALSLLMLDLPVEMRVEPSSITQSGTASHYTCWGNESTTACSAVPTIRNSSNKKVCAIDMTFSSLNSATGTYVYRITNTAGFIGVSAEL